VSAIGDDRYANLCLHKSVDRSFVFAELAGKNGYAVWLQSGTRRCLVCRYRVAGGQLTVWQSSGDTFRRLTDDGTIRTRDGNADLASYLAGGGGGHNLFLQGGTTFVRAVSPPPPTSSFLTNLQTVRDNPGAYPPGLWAVWYGTIASGTLILAALLGLVLLWWFALGRRAVCRPAPGGRSHGVRRALSGAFAGAVGAGIVCVVAMATELVIVATSTVHGGLVALGFRTLGQPHVWSENARALGLAMGLGATTFVLINVFSAVRHPNDLKPVAKPKAGGRTVRRFVAACLWAAAIAAVGLATTRGRVTAAGWLRGETCYRGLPAGYWVAELRSWVKVVGVGHPGPYGTVSPYEYLDASGHVTVLGKGIGRDAVPGLVEMLGDPDGEVRNLAVIALARIGPRATDAVPALIRHFEAEPDVEVRVNIVDALRLIDPATAKTLGWE
jgi:hypothetical protein